MGAERKEARKGEKLQGLRGGGKTEIELGGGPAGETRSLPT